MNDLGWYSRLTATATCPLDLPPYMREQKGLSKSLGKHSARLQGSGYREQPTREKTETAAVKVSQNLYFIRLGRGTKERDLAPALLQSCSVCARCSGHQKSTGGKIGYCPTYRTQLQGRLLLELSASGTEGNPEEATSYFCSSENCAVGRGFGWFYLPGKEELCSRSQLAGQKAAVELVTGFRRRGTRVNLQRV